MSRFIRWQGTIAFIVLTALVAGFLYFFAESIAKSAIVSSAESVFGAEVNLVEVELAYSPLTVKLVDFQVTDKELPSHNLFSFKQATAAVDVWQYLFGKIIIDELEVSELAFSEERAQVGEVFQDIESEDESESLSSQAKAMLPEVDMQLPDVKTLLNDSNLLTVKASEDLKASYKSEQAKLKALKEKLPTKEKVNYYKEKVTALSKVKVKTLDDIQKIAKDYEAIKTEFKADQALIKEAKQQVIASKELLTKQSLALKNAPGEDWKTIEKTYQLESVDAEDFAHIIFGEQAREYYQKAQWLYENVAPLLGGGNKAEEEVKTYAKGRFVYFDEENPLPSVLIKKALLSMKLDQADFIIEGTELTHQHWLRGKDSKVSVSSTSNGEVELNTQFKLDKSGEFVSDGNWFAKNRTVSDSALAQSKALTLSLDKALVSGEGTFTLVNKKIISDNHISLNETSYQGEASTKMMSLLLDTVKSLDKLSLDVAVKGELDKPSFSIGSSLNDALSGAFKKQVSGKVDEFKTKVNAGLNEKLSDTLKLSDSQFSEIVDLEALLTDTDKTLEDLKNSDVVKQQKKKLEDELKNKAKDKVKDKLKGKLGGLLG